MLRVVRDADAREEMTAGLDEIFRDGARRTPGSVSLATRASAVAMSTLTAVALIGPGLARPSHQACGAGTSALADRP